MTSPSPKPLAQPARRTVVAAVGVTGLAAALAACGASNSSSAGSDSGSGSGSSGGGSGATDVALTKTTDIPEGGGKIFADNGVVVTQPSAGTFKAFSSTCTHQGCTVGSVMNGLIVCPCHGSEFSVVDGSVKRGPAQLPLPPKKITVSGGEITLD